MNIREVYQQLHEIYRDWSKSKSTQSSSYEAYLTNYLFIQNGSSITWDKWKPDPLPHQVMASHITGLVDNGQYTFQVSDGSIFQLYYQYKDKNTLQSARLAFYKAQTYVESEFNLITDYYRSSQISPRLW
jgi:hypothetical protein